MGILRVGHVDLKVGDLDQALHHYVNIIGLSETSRDAHGRVYLKAWDEWDAYSLVLSPAGGPGLNHIAYKVEHDNDLNVLAEKIGSHGVEVSWNAEGYLHQCGRSIGFDLPSGHRMYLYAEKAFIGKAVGTLNPEPWPDGLLGAGVHWLDHVMLTCPVDENRGINTVVTTTDFLMQVLGFNLAEQVVTDDEGKNQFATWLFRGTKAHDLALGAGGGTGLHHIAFYLEDWNAVLRGADILGKHKVPMDVTPQRHAITRGQTTYFFDPSGNRNEMFAGMGYFAQPDMPTITWLAKDIWRGIFFHDGTPRPDFLENYT
ncbi:catechol 2,3-dioxygenase [Pseudomonas sp. RIT623]|uniref:catechol 2,3-dioxygenase n=1 Tax=Pseudomonas sp. RIT623 TaxID=2559075 RepID=UPI00106F0FC1|nr:catechol 2,3-dioxygenase [Pseudomonas sp. RIT623]TFF42588.1 catechol 2,3-dioxygenase [Pseudomonas sp. RIT623]